MEDNLNVNLNGRQPKFLALIAALYMTICVSSCSCCCLFQEVEKTVKRHVIIMHQCITNYDSLLVCAGLKDWQNI